MPQPPYPIFMRLIKRHGLPPLADKVVITERRRFGATGFFTRFTPALKVAGLMPNGTGYSENRSACDASGRRHTVIFPDHNNLPVPQRINALPPDDGRSVVAFRSSFFRCFFLFRFVSLYTDGVTAHL